MHAVVVRRAAVKYVRERDVATSSRLILGVGREHRGGVSVVPGLFCRADGWSVGVTEIISREAPRSASQSRSAPGIHSTMHTRTPTPRADGVRQNRQRTVTEVETYDEMKRRGPRKRKVAYLTVDGQRTGAKRDSITAGVATLERVVAQRYDWRDAGLGATRKRRQGGLLGDEEEDARGKRRR